MDDIQNLFKETIAEFMEGSLDSELDEELGYEPYDVKNKSTDNSRNGHSKKTLKTSTCSFNLAFAQLMNDETSTAIRTLDCCLDQNADVYYLRAVAYARMGDKANALKNLKESVAQNYEYKSRAQTDVEFRAYWEDKEFKTIVQLYTEE